MSCHPRALTFSTPPSPPRRSSDLPPELPCPSGLQARVAPLYRLAARQAFPAELGVRGDALAPRQADAAQIWPDEICPRRRARDGDARCAFRALRHQLRPDPRRRGICRRTDGAEQKAREPVVVPRLYEKPRSEERSVGEKGVSTGRSRW